MQHTVKLPKLGETSDSVLVLRWLVEVGEEVSQGQGILLVETDKVDAEVPTPIGGSIIELMVTPDDEVPVGAPLCVIRTESR